MIMKRSPRKLTLGALLGRGYFPPELPPPFRTASFAHSVRLARLASLPQELTKQKNDWCDFVSYSLARPGSLRRRLAILNPLAYFRLARFIVRHQHAILKKTGASDLSIGKPVVHLFGRLGRAVGYDAVPLRRALVRIGQRFLLVADVSRFYPSIYTHSIDWAMSSKTRAKRQLRRRSKKLSVGASLDRLVQACQSGQTRGIPIGPAVSILLSELVLARVDGRLKAQKVTTGFRYADDYELNFSDRLQAERALAVLEDALAQFELELNPAKTNISELPQELDNPGIQELRCFKFRPTYQAERSDLLHFFTRAFALHRDFPDKPILRYAVSRLPASNVKAANAALMQALILQAVAYESGVWPMAIDQLLELHDAQPAVTTIDIGTTVHSMIRKCAHLNHSWQNVQMAKASTSWPTTTGRITASDTVKVMFRRQPRITYSYSVNGAPFTSQRVSFAGGYKPKDVDPTLARYPVGSEVTVAHDPQKPAEATLETGATKQVTAQVRILLICFVLIVAFNILSFFMRSPSRRYGPPLRSYGWEALSQSSKSC
jgi:hypothetical protein